MAVQSGSFDGVRWYTGTTILESINPATGESLGQVGLADDVVYLALIEQAQKTFLSWRHMPAPKRALVLAALRTELIAQKQSLGLLITQEMGKALNEGLGEVQEMIDMADFAIGQSRMLYGHTMPSERPEHRLFEQWHPLGVVGVITAFNFPMAVWAWNAFLAMIAGNVVIWKPSSKTPLCAIAVMRLAEKVCQELHMMNPFLCYLPGAESDKMALVQDTRIPLISFTGSCATGQKVAQAVAARMGRSLLELGGNNAIIVDESADLALALRAIVFGAIGTAGQRCTTTRRVFIHEKHYKLFLKQLCQAYAQLRIGNPADVTNHMGPLVDKAAVVGYLEALEKIQAQQGTMHAGGKVLSDLGPCYVAPTIVEIAHTQPIVQQETFAPILYVFAFKDFTEALRLQNAVPQGLSSACFTRDLQRAEQFLSVVGSDCGIANINVGTSGAEIGGAFGGEKQTGGGREAGSDAWKAYMRRQTVTLNFGDHLPLAQGIDFKL